MASPPLPSPSPSLLSLDGWLSIVTGASRGICLAITFQLSFLGVRLILDYSTNSAQADLLTAEINTSSPNFVVPIQADVSTTIVDSLRPAYRAYTASKAAVEAMIKIMAKELRGAGITVNYMVPGWWRWTCSSQERAGRP